MTKMFVYAREFAKLAHKGQTRWGGEDYFDAHVAKVVQYVEDNYFDIFPDHITGMSIYKEPILTAS